jgi:hypothetical protein
MDDMLKVVRCNLREQIPMIRTRPLDQKDLIKYQDEKIEIESPTLARKISQT